MSWLIPLDELTPDQIRAIQLDIDQNHAILGAPGSGKTQVLLHRARYLSDDYDISPERFHVFVFTNVLKNYIRSGLTDLDLPEDCVTTLDDWCIQVYRREISARLPWNEREHCTDYAAIREAVHEVVEGQQPFDFILVDEGQDLDEKAFALLKDLAPHVTVAMDHKQQIYAEGSDEAVIVRALGLKRSDLTLLDAFRCCPYIVRLASEFIEDAAEREAFLNQSRTSQSDIETPLLYEADGWEDELEKLADVLRTRQLAGDRSIGILVTQRYEVKRTGKYLKERGFDVEIQAGKGKAQENQNLLDFRTSLPKVLTIHSAKGLTFDSVLLPKLTERMFPGNLGALAARLLYVGITRAIRWVYMSAEERYAIRELDRVRRLAELKPPIVTLGHEIAGASAKPSPDNRLDEDDPLNILR